MANPFDARARLAEGRPAVDDIEEYVLACRRLGYQHQDLTTHPTQVRDWYDGEDGLDLRALDADCAVLARAAVIAEDVARTHTDLAAELSGAWSGRGAAAAHEFAWRSGQAATSVSAAIRGAADALAALRDELWRVVDAKVATVQAIDGRHRAERAEWLAAARTVTTGGGDLATASELVDQQVKPFVANDIGSDWVGAMRAAIAAVGAAYDMAIARTSLGPSAVFDVPGELGPRAASAAGGGTETATTTTPAAAVAPVPATVGIPAAASTFSPQTAPVSGPAWAGQAPAVAAPAVDPGASAPLTPPAAAAPSMPSMGGLGGAAPALGSGVSGFGQQLADLIGGLFGSADGAEGLAGTDASSNDPEDQRLDDPAADDEEGDDDIDEEEGDVDEEPSSDDESEADAAAESGADAGEEIPLAVAPEPTPVPPPAALEGVPAVALAAPESADEAGGQTPCEIAADELPQVGE